MKKWLILFSLIIQPLYSDIIRITASWDPIQCERTCVFNLDRLLVQSNRVADIDIRRDSGILTFRWLPTVLFDFTVIKRAFQLVGLGLQTVDIEVRGVVRWRSDSDVTLLSIGDNTQFVLLGPLLVDTVNYVNPGNRASYPIRGELRDQLMRASREQKVVVIQGTFFMPRLPPFMISINKLQL